MQYWSFHIAYVHLCLKRPYEQPSSDRMIVAGQIFFYPRNTRGKQLKGDSASTAPQRPYIMHVTYAHLSSWKLGDRSCQKCVAELTPLCTVHRIEERPIVSH